MIKRRQLLPPFVLFSAFLIVYLSNATAWRFQKTSNNCEFIGSIEQGPLPCWVSGLVTETDLNVVFGVTTEIYQHTYVHALTRGHNIKEGRFEGNVLSMQYLCPVGESGIVPLDDYFIIPGLQISKYGGNYMSGEYPPRLSIYKKNEPVVKTIAMPGLGWGCLQAIHRDGDSFWTLCSTTVNLTQSNTHESSLFADSEAKRGLFLQNIAYDGSIREAVRVLPDISTSIDARNMVYDRSTDTMVILCETEGFRVEKKSYLLRLDMEGRELLRKPVQYEKCNLAKLTILDSGLLWISGISPNKQGNMEPGNFHEYVALYSFNASFEMQTQKFIKVYSASQRNISNAFCMTSRRDSLYLYLPYSIYAEHENGRLYTGFRNYVIAELVYGPDGTLVRTGTVAAGTGSGISINVEHNPHPDHHLLSISHDSRMTLITKSGEVDIPKGQHTFIRVHGS